VESVQPEPVIVTVEKVVEVPVLVEKVVEKVVVKQVPFFPEDDCLVLRDVNDSHRFEVFCP